MNAKLAAMVQRVKDRCLENPPEDDDALIDGGTLLQIEIAQSGESFSEDDVLEAALKVGLSKESLIDFLEEMASWV